VIDKPGITVTHSSGTHAVHSLALTNGTFTLSGGALDVSGTVQGNSTFTLAGGTLASATVQPGLTIKGTNAGVTLSELTLNGNLELANPTGISKGTVTNGLTLNGTVSLGGAFASGQLLFSGTQALTGNGTVVFGSAYLSQLVEITNGATLTI